MVIINQLIFNKNVTCVKFGMDTEMWVFEVHEVEMSSSTAVTNVYKSVVYLLNSWFEEVKAVHFKKSGRYPFSFSSLWEPQILYVFLYHMDVM